MRDKERMPITGYCPTQGKQFTVYGNYISDGFGGYALGTISCPYKELANPCSENPCPLRSALKENI